MRVRAEQLLERENKIDDFVLLNKKLIFLNFKQIKNKNKIFKNFHLGTNFAGLIET